MTRSDIRVRLRHRWISMMAFPLTEEQAARMASGDESDLRSHDGPLAMKFTSPVCERCQLDYDEAPYSCQGEPVSFAPNGEPLFGE